MGSCQSSSAASERPRSTVTTPVADLSKLKPTAAKPQDPLAPPSSEANSPVNFMLNLTENKPLDASDITDVDAAKAELQKIRKFAKEFLEGVGTAVDDDIKVSADAIDKHNDNGVRGALYDKQDFASFKTVSYEKTDAIRTLIYDSIKPNVLFEHDTQEEILQIIDVFKPLTYKKGEVVIQQGDEGAEFYVVESGSLSIHVTVKGEEDDDNEESQVKVGDYTKGSAFGELALIFGSPRAATITATDDCKLWSIERLSYRSVISKLRYEQHVEKSAFLRTCVVSGRHFTDIFDGSQIEDLTIATKVDVYQAGEVILREGEMGDTFYILKSGSICTLKDGEEYGKVDEKKAFGTTSLIRGEVSPLTYKAASKVAVYYLTRQDFEDISKYLFIVLYVLRLGGSMGIQQSKYLN